VSGKEKISISKSDALNVSAVATACEKSYRTGQPVELSLSSDDLVVSGFRDDRGMVVNGQP